IADQALQLIAPMRRNLGVGVQGKALDAGTAGTGERWGLARGAKPRANAPDPLAGPLPKSHALLHRSGHRAGELRGVLSQGVIAGRHHRVATRFEVPQMAERANDPPTDLLDHGGDGGVGRRLPLDKPGLEACLGAIEVDALKKDAMKMEIEIDGTAETLDKGDRSRLDIGPLETSCDRL